ncbi:Predicted PurR-regulated permease PerM [Peptoclostridium litorale DSM 5388]|uniref:AI-2E family transporter n=1 Tax=Peptoclostridium litorale DSM 5388 TaxID=1121324 RepID=A0A069RHK6_PEPLI|nr:AI-2E family transporter [Peptoclostridium litorale]KDR93742.1 hypothetical protein CLIT_23c00140 [Peptoclostridium litorale DSM 5388]SIN84949.1 Predicted PurR-regulated permease PerM [Peptoclostridium litorale DSM 5388]
MFYEEKTFEYLIYTILTLIIVFLLGRLDFVLIPLKDAASLILVPILVGGLFYYMLRPVVHMVEKRRIGRKHAVTIVLLGMMIILTGIAIYGGNSIRKEFADFYDYFNEQISGARQSTRGIFGEGDIPVLLIENITGYIVSILEVMFSKFGKNILGLFPTIAGIGTQLILIPFALFYFLKDGHRFLPIMLNVFPERHRDDAKKILIDIDRVIAGYTTGQLMVAFVIGVLMYIGYIIIDLPNALVLSIFAMITSIIPFLGAFLGVLPALLVGITIDMFYIVKIGILSLVVQQIESKFISPNIIGTKLEVHPLTIIFIIIIAISLFGIIGAFIAVPAYAVIKMLAKYYIRIKKTSKE